LSGASINCFDWEDPVSVELLRESGGIRSTGVQMVIDKSGGNRSTFPELQIQADTQNVMLALSGVNIFLFSMFMKIKYFIV